MESVGRCSKQMRKVNWESIVNFYGYKWENSIPHWKPNLKKITFKNRKLAMKSVICKFTGFFSL